MQLKPHTPHPHHALLQIQTRPVSQTDFQKNTGTLSQAIQVFFKQPQLNPTEKYPACLMSLTKNEFFVGSVLFFYLTVSVMVTSKPSPTLKHVIIRQYDNMYVLLPLGDKLPLE